MSRSLLFGAALTASVGLAATPALAIDQHFPTYGNTGYDVSNYDIALDVDSEKNTLQGVTKITFTAERALSVFTLDLSGLTVQSVRVDGLRAKFTHQNDKLIVTTPYLIKPGRESVVAVTYGGTPVPLQDPLDPDTPTVILGWMHVGKATTVVSEPIGASTFYPVNDEPTDRATFRFRITVPKPYTAVANGKFVDVTDAAGDRRTFTWVVAQPMSTWLATVSVNEFKESIAYTQRGIPVRVFTTALTPQEEVDRYLSAAKMIDWLEPLVGPYPFASYGSVTVDYPPFYYALETLGMSTFPTYTGSYEVVVVHELVHQWFGNSVSVAQWRDLWLAEGYATYLSMLWLNRTSPADFDAAVKAVYDFLVEHPMGPAVVEEPTKILSNRPYLRGALTIYALREKVGEPMFYKILKTWTSWFRNRPATTAEFLDTAVLVSGDPTVRDALMPWLYGDTLPPFPGPVTPASKAVSARGAATLETVLSTRCAVGHGRGTADCAR